MKPSIKGSFLSMCGSFNLYHFLTIFIVSTLLMVFSFTSANSMESPESFKENKKLSSLLEQEQFQLGLSCDEAMQVYLLDEKKSMGSQRARVESSRLGLNDGKVVEPGFFSGACRDKQLSYVNKIVTVDNGTLVQKLVFDNFIKQYGKPSSQREDGYYLQYFLLYNGRYTDFRLALHEKDNQTITVYELEDVTSQVGK